MSRKYLIVYLITATRQYCLNFIPGEKKKSDIERLSILDVIRNNAQRLTASISEENVRGGRTFSVVSLSRGHGVVNGNDRHV